MIPRTMGYPLFTIIAELTIAVLYSVWCLVQARSNVKCRECDLILHWHDLYQCFSWLHCAKNQTRYCHNLHGLKMKCIVKYVFQFWSTFSTGKSNSLWRCNCSQYFFESYLDDPLFNLAVLEKKNIWSTKWWQIAAVLDMNTDLFG